MSNYIHKEHNVTMLCYHIVTVVKYRRKLINFEIDEAIRETCAHIENSHDIKFIEVGIEDDHVHWLLQSVPTWCVTKIATTIKSITARNIKKASEHARGALPNGSFWTRGYYAATVNRDVAEETIRRYIARQGGGSGYRRLIHDGNLARYMQWRQTEHGGRQ